MKVYKLYTHQKSFSSADLVLNSNEHPDANIGDIVEIYHPEDGSCRLLLQVTCFNEELKGREVISIEASIASTFNLKTYSDVIMQAVNSSAVALDSVELTFKDKYMGRSEMWRLKTHLSNSCVYVNKKIDYCDMSIRCQVMWSQGDRVSCGVITDDTKIVFRSSTSMVYLFLQMSSEMWDFDIHGDLYFEKAVNGFLTDLFMKWKKLGCNHEVTIVLFSRTFYAAKSLDEFPQHMKDCLQMDYKKRFYEDFYRVAIQNERNEDWCLILVQLRKLFTSYRSTVLRYHERKEFKIPTAVNSTAAQGNFLEVLNISLNTFEKHYLDRSFDRTGQLSVVITPGVGVFEVDRELTNITKQRIIDNGVGSDLVCVGEQPLHAVPLLKFHNKDTSLTSADDYSLPHWINLSFYSTNKKVAYSTFIPRIKIPTVLSQQPENDKENSKIKFLSCNQSEYIHNSLFDYDAYDAQIFQLPPAQGTCSLQRVIRAKKTSVPSLETYAFNNNNDWDSTLSNKLPNYRRKMSDPDIYHGISAVLSNLTSSTDLLESLASENNASRSIVSITPIIRPGRALINPFDPKHVTIKLTSNRRRWTHIFPKGPTGVLIQQHHYQAVPAKSNTNTNNNITGYNSFEYCHSNNCSSISNTFSANLQDELPLDLKKRSSINTISGTPITTPTTTAPSKSLTFLWGATGEQEWTPALTTAGEGKIIIGVDWKSLTIPACLPITTDYFPEERSLHNDYVISDYTLLPDAVTLDCANSRAVYRKPLTTEEVFKEIISQRLAQGFQLIVLEDKTSTPSQAPCCGGLKTQSLVFKNPPTIELKKEYLLSIGRIFHKISLVGSVIKVTGYRPRHPYPPINVDYRYRFHAPQHNTYEVSGVHFTTEKLENYNWNYMDHYICTRGDTDYPLLENLKYWRYRMYLLPKEHQAMKKILEGNNSKCDIYTEIRNDHPKQIIDDFIRFVELHLNKVKRTRKESPTIQTHLTKRRHSTSIISRPPTNQGLTNSPFRERVGSNRLPEKRPSALPRVGSKPLERGRVSPAAEAAIVVPEVTTTDDSDDAFICEVKFKSNSSLSEIFDAMKHQVSGVGFFTPMQSLPASTFISYDALMWLKNRIEPPSNPLEILENMRREKLICHASGDWNKPVIPGFFFYYIVSQEKTTKDLNNSSAFENEWLEIEIKSKDYLHESFEESNENDIPNFLREIPISKWNENRNIYLHSHLEIDANQKSDRMEWGHVKYHSVMVPGNAFEIVVEWVTASGPIVCDLISGWKRKALQCGFQLVPIPADPLAEPFTEKSDPLRGPIFIPLNVKSLYNEGNLFEEFDIDTRSERMLLFQEAILERFGFMPCRVQKKFTFEKNIPKEHQYVHCSGNMFVLIRCSQSVAPIDSPTRKEYNVTRLVYGHTDNTNVPRKVGFLWSWNHMIANKKWKSLVINHSEGEIFQLRMLNDFKDFCSNEDRRLTTFWETSKAKAIKLKN